MYIKKYIHSYYNKLSNGLFMKNNYISLQTNEVKEKKGICPPLVDSIIQFIALYTNLSTSTYYHDFF